MITPHPHYDVLTGEDVPDLFEFDPFLDDVPGAGCVVRSTIGRLSIAGLIFRTGSLALQRLTEHGFGERTIIVQLVSAVPGHEYGELQPGNMPWIQCTDEEAELIQKISGLRAERSLKTQQPGFWEFEDE